MSDRNKYQNVKGLMQLLSSPTPNKHIAVETSGQHIFAIEKEDGRVETMSPLST